MSIASYLLFGILGFLSMVLVQLIESLILPGTMDSLVQWSLSTAFGCSLLPWGYTTGTAPNNLFKAIKKPCSRAWL